MNQIIIIGNSGSGKSWLATRLGTRLSIPVTHLDDLFWEPGGFSHKRPQTLVYRDIEKIEQTRQWIVEGVFGELAARLVDNADTLIWLDMAWDDCRANLLRRGSESHKQLDKEAAEASFQRLLVWASRYWERDDMRSYTGHKQLFDHFRQHKKRLQSKQAVDRILADPSLLHTASPE